MIENIIPIVISLKQKLQAAKSPLISDIFNYLRKLMEDYKNEVKDILAADKQLAKEIEFDLRRHEQQQEEERQQREEEFRKRRQQEEEQQDHHSSEDGAEEVEEDGLLFCTKLPSLLLLRLPVQLLLLLNLNLN